MKAIILIDIDENHLLKETNELYDRLKGYKCELKPLPEKKERPSDLGERDTNDWFHMGCVRGWNACIDEIMGETE